MVSVRIFGETLQGSLVAAAQGAKIWVYLCKLMITKEKKISDWGLLWRLCGLKAQIRLINKFLGCNFAHFIQMWPDEAERQPRQGAALRVKHRVFREPPYLISHVPYFIFCESFCCVLNSLPAGVQRTKTVPHPGLAHFCFVSSCGKKKKKCWV